MPHPIDHLLDVMTRLRDPQGGCPWDIEQTFASIVPHTIEEAYEVAEAIELGDIAQMKDELGDLLFQVVFYAQIGREAGHFDFNAIAQGIADKMIRRHPHVFGSAAVDSAEEQIVAWEALKAGERQDKADGQPPSALDGVSTALPAMTRAIKLQKRAGRVGFDWPEAAPVLDKIAEEAAEIKQEMANGADPERLRDELGDLLFSVVNLARKLDIDPETALRAGNRKFERRFHAVEAALAAQGRGPADATLDEMDSLWDSAKRQES